jgi:hypothetical protein
MGSSYGDGCRIRFSPCPVMALMELMVVRHAPSRYVKAALCKNHLPFLSLRNPLYQSVAFEEQDLR